jgi:hypothetical protein
VQNRWVIRRLAAGELLSSSGSWAAGIATSFFMYRRTGSALWVAGTLFFTFGIAGSSARRPARSPTDTSAGA